MVPTRGTLTTGVSKCLEKSWLRFEYAPRKIEDVVNWRDERKFII